MGGESSLGSQLNSVTSDNIGMKLDEKLKDTQSSVTNNMMASVQKMKPKDKDAIPAVRNQEETFQRMIYNNTRVV